MAEKLDNHPLKCKPDRHISLLYRQQKLCDARKRETKSNIK